MSRRYAHCLNVSTHTRHRHNLFIGLYLLGFKPTYDIDITHCTDLLILPQVSI